MGGSRRRAAVLRAVTVAVAITVAASGCAGAGAPPAAAPVAAGPGPVRPVVVASFNFAESELLAEIYAQALEGAGVPVRRELDLGPRELVRPAVEEGLADVVPEYVGTALLGVDPAATAAAHRSPAAARAALQQALTRWHISVLAPAAAEDRDGFAVTAATARRWHLRTLSDLAPVASRLVLGGPSECVIRPLCLPGLERTYGLRFRGFRAVDDEQQRATALREGVVDVAVTFTTDPRLADGSLVLLRDDRDLQPYESVVPIVRDAVLQEYGYRVSAALDAVSQRLDSAALVFLGWRLAEGGDVRGEARGWLLRHDLPAG